MIKDIEAILANVREREKINDIYGAWEVLKEYQNEKPEMLEKDRLLSKKSADLAVTQASRLAALLHQAETSKKEGEYGAALAKYLEARQLYFPSRFAEAGIKSILEQVIPEDGE